MAPIFLEAAGSVVGVGVGCRLTKYPGPAPGPSLGPGPHIFDMSLESPGTGGTSIRLSLHETNETYPGHVSFVRVHGLPPVPGTILGHGKI